MTPNQRHLLFYLGRAMVVFLACIVGVFLAFFLGAAPQ